MPKYEKISICDGVKFTSIKNSNFKTNRISLTMFLPLDKKFVSKNAILPFILSHSSKKYDTFKSFNKRLDELYGASLNCSINKIGDNHAIILSITSLDDRYAFDKTKISQELSEFLCEVIFKPNLDEYNNFKIDDINQEKRQLVELIDSELNDKRTYSKIKCEQIMFAHEKFGINKFGDKFEVENLTSQDIFNAWSYALKTAKIEIFMLGNSDPKFAIDVFKKEILKLKRNYNDNHVTRIIEKSEKITEQKEEKDISQCKLVMGFRTGLNESIEEKDAMRLAINLLGGTPSSKLFLNVREKMSLCYYCSVKYDRFKQVMMVDSGVEKDNIEKAKKEILNQLNAIKIGDFTERDINIAKMAMINSLKTTYDHLGALEIFYLFQTFDNVILSPNEQAKNISKITREGIIKAANKISLDTVFTLESKN